MFYAWDEVRKVQRNSFTLYLPSDGESHEGSLAWGEEIPFRDDLSQILP